jgi:hypothetical protein
MPCIEIIGFDQEDEDQEILTYKTNSKKPSQRIISSLFEGKYLTPIKYNYSIGFYAFFINFCCYL